MTDLHTRFRTLDSLSAPNLWSDIEERAMAIQPTRRSSAWVLITVTLLLALIIGAAALVGSGIVKLPISVDASASPSSTAQASARESTHASSSPVEVVPASWIATGSMNEAHQSNTATVLADGRVLVVGGFGAGGAVAAAELYDPITRSWTATGDPAEGRTSHTATLLADGRVLVAGGATGGNVSPYAPSASVELYDPRSGSWTTTASMSTPRSEHTATLLLDGTVLVAGGKASFTGPTLASAEVYDSATGSWTAAGPMIQARAGHAATRLSDGRVLVAGGSGSSDNFEGMASAELYDTATGSWTAAENMHEGRFAATATLLLDGTVLVAGGNAGDLYDPASGSWTATGNMIQARSYHTATLLADGTLLVAGGAFGDALASAELYDPATSSWAATAEMLQPRYGPTAALLADGTVLVAGGSPTVIDPPGSTSAELYDPGSGT